jgi:hypothetical protein
MKIKLFFLTTIITLCIEKNNAAPMSKEDARKSLSELSNYALLNIYGCRIKHDLRDNNYFNEKDVNDYITYLFEGDDSAQKIKIYCDAYASLYNIYQKIIRLSQKDELTCSKQYVKAQKFKELFVKNDGPTKDEIIKFIQDDKITAKELDLPNKEKANA